MRVLKAMVADRLTRSRSHRREHPSITSGTTEPR
jgi:hypothetical protein